MNLKKLLSLVAVATVSLSVVACEGQTEKKEDQKTAESTETPALKEGVIDVVSREAGSGTRQAFEEIIGFNGEGQTPLTENVTIKDGNGVVATYVAENEQSIGYVSFVTLHENEGSIEGLTVDGVEATPENVLNGDYAVARPFEMVYMDENLTDVERAFIEFAASQDGLDILDENGTIVDNSKAEAFDMTKYDQLSGNLMMGGSTSTESVVKALADEFCALFPKVTYEYNATGSSAGVKNAIDGTYKLGFASREIKDSELESGLQTMTLCMDGIALVVNPTNEVEDISTEQIKEVYTGNITEWSALAK